MGLPILCLDFDGVLHSYTSGWKGTNIVPDAPVAGMVTFLEKAVKVFNVQIFSSRSNQPGGRQDREVLERITLGFDPKDILRAEQSR